MITTKKKVFTGLAAVAGLMAIGAMIPRAANAVYSSPVSVVNPSNQPVQGADVEKLARIPYQSTYRTTSCVNVTNCFFQFAPAPQGFRLVVENISGIFELANNATAPATGLIEGSNFLNTFGFTSTNGQIFNGTIMSGVNQPTHMVFDNSEGDPVAFVYGDYPPITGLPSFITLSGYLENCSITGCPTIQR